MRARRSFRLVIGACLLASLVLAGYAAAVTIVGTSGHDVLRGTKRVDVLRGKAGADWIYGRQGADRLYGDKGDDMIVGGAGPDRLYGGAGADLIKARDGQLDVLSCGSGVDVVTVDRKGSCGRRLRAIEPQPRRDRYDGDHDDRYDDDGNGNDGHGDDRRHDGRRNDRRHDDRRDHRQPVRPLLSLLDQQVAVPCLHLGAGAVPGLRMSGGISQRRAANLLVARSRRRSTSALPVWPARTR